MSSSSTKKKKNKRKKKIVIVNLGDTIKLSKGRIGLVRFMGKTQFGLGEWVGIELYNELIKTRHNGAVLGKRYFRCPANRGVFVRRQLIKENIAVLEIEKNIKNLRKKEKKLKDERKKKLKQQKLEKKKGNEAKREAKQEKIRQKYALKEKEKESKKQQQTNKKAESAPNLQSNLPASFNTNKRRAREKSPAPPRKSKKGEKDRKNGSKKKKPKPSLNKSASGPSSMKKPKVTPKIPNKHRTISDPMATIINKKSEQQEEPIIVRKYKATRNDDSGSLMKTPLSPSSQIIVNGDNGDNNKKSKKPVITVIATKTINESDDESDDEPTPTESPKAVPASPKEQKITKKNHYKLKSFNTQFKEELEIRNSQNSLQLLFMRQRVEKQVQEKQEEKAKRETPTVNEEEEEEDDDDRTKKRTKINVNINDSENDDDRKNQETLSPLTPQSVVIHDPLSPQSPDIDYPNGHRKSVEILDDEKETEPYDLPKPDEKKRKKCGSDLSNISPKLRPVGLATNKSKTLLVDVVDDDPDLDADYDWDSQKVDIWKKEQKLNSAQKNNEMSGLELIKQGKQSKSAVILDDNDGVLESDDSLNDSENDEDDTEQEEDEEERKVLEEEFEKNYENYSSILDQYTHKIDDFESARKKLANKIVDIERKKRKRSSDMAKLRASAMAKQKQIKPYPMKINAALMQNNRKHADAVGIDGFPMKSKRSKKSKKHFNNARSRRASSFVDDYNIQDTLFFDVDEDANNVNNANKFYVDNMNETDDEDDADDIDDEEKEQQELIQKSIEIAKQNEQEKTIKEEEEEETETDNEEDDETDAEDKDPLLGRMEDIVEEDEEEDDDWADNDNEDKYIKKPLDIIDDDTHDDDEDSLNESEENQHEHDHAHEDEEEEEEEHVKIFDVLKDNRDIKVITFYVELDEFLTWNPDNDGYGMMITTINKNEYGKALYVETGVEVGWSITDINDDDITKMMQLYIQSVLKRINVEKGYTLTMKKQLKRMNSSEHGDNLKPSIYVKSKKK